MNVKEVMTKDLITLEPDASILDAAQLMKKFNVGTILITQNDKLTGILTDRDIVLRLIAENIDCQDAKLKDFMSQSPVSVSSNEDIQFVADMMAEHQIKRLPIIENNKLVGIVTLGDLSMVAPEQAQEVLEQCSKPLRKDIAA
ncbi:hypothetical protein LCGC14_0858810 [marine sediment metagenome]|uniref:CBS domain-containing protein n=1 Tax=marine sediment metagenome TaxID=412755 RepID=A0A0F9RSN5_9ZZZZ